MGNTNGKPKSYIARFELGLNRHVETFECNDIELAKVVFMNHVTSLYPNKKETEWNDTLLSALDLLDLPENVGKLVMRFSLSPIDDTTQLLIAHQYLVDPAEVDIMSEIQLAKTASAAISQINNTDWAWRGSRRRRSQDVPLPLPLPPYYLPW